MFLPCHGISGKQDIASLNESELLSLTQELGLPKFRASQLALALGNLQDIRDISVLPLSLREKISQNWAVCKVDVVKKQVSSDGTEKYLYRLGDGELVEGVFMRYHHGNTLCISTQAGCRMGCAFCASCLNGLARGLNPSELLGEIKAAERETGERVDGIVMMGTGEPLDNFDAVTEFIDTVSSERSLNIGQRHISLSTSGIVPRIYDLASRNYGITLSVSLHATTDELRSQLMPVNRSWHLAELLEATNAYQKMTGRRVSYEYAMIRGVNDSPEDAERLASLLADSGSHVNLIRLNEIKESPFKPSTPLALSEFISILEKRHVNVTLRRRLGKDIDGACGQLRKSQTDAQH